MNLHNYSATGSSHPKNWILNNNNEKIQAAAVLHGEFPKSIITQVGMS